MVQAYSINEKTVKDHRLALGHYSLLLTIYSIYGYQVCPFLEQLELYQLIGPAAIMLAIQYGLRIWLNKAYQTLSLEKQTKARFWGDFSLFLFGGSTIAVFNLVAFGYPLDSGVKVLIAFASLGFYISLDLALEREFLTGKQMSSAGLSFPINSQFMPYQQKFTLFSTINLFILAVVCILVIFKDLIWSAHTDLAPRTQQLLIMAEVLFVVFVIGAYITRVTKQYSRNLNANIAAENKALKLVQEGCLDVQVPITSNDEFGHMADLTNQMIKRLKQSTEELELTQNVTVMSLIALAAKRDNETGMHIKRTQTYIAVIADALKKNPPYQNVITDDMIDLLYKSAPLHDIGKVGIPDAILLKPGKLDDDEFEIMKTHAQIGADALKEAEQLLGNSTFLSMAREIAETHHEKWDGTGYPNGLKGTDIPLSGRLMAIADVYDALRSARIYKTAYTHEKSLEMIIQDSGTHFDPDIVKAFLSIEPVIKQLSQEMSDETSGKNSIESYFKASPLTRILEKVGNVA